MGEPCIVILCDKPSSAQSIAMILSSATSEPDQEVIRRKQGDLAVYEYYGYNDVVKHYAKFKVTSAVGNLLNLNFDPPLKEGTDEIELYSAVLGKKPNKQRIVNHVVAECRDAALVLCAFENDRKGECKTFETIEVLRDTVSARNILRCRISALTEVHVREAIAHPVAPHHGMAAAWDMVQQVNIRVGQSFMRYLQKVFLQRYLNCDADAVCYGVGITPTLALCVNGASASAASSGVAGSRVLTVHDVESRQKWTLSALPPKMTLDQLHAKLTETKGLKAKVTHVKTDVKEGQQEVGLNIVSLMELASRELGFGPGYSVQLAENLYLDGYITYPRTQATNYPTDFKFSLLPIQPSTLMKQRTVPRSDGQIPITPLTNDFDDLTGDRLNLFQIIFGQYTATCSVRVTTATMQLDCIPEAIFTCQGIAVTGVLPLTLKRALPKLPPSSALPTAKVLTLSRVGIEDAGVAKKAYGAAARYTEADLIADMGRLGIGADGSMGPYINTICDRNFIKLDPKTRVIHVTNLGQALYRGFCDIDSQLVDTALRAQMEATAASIEMGRTAKSDGEKRFVSFFREKFDRVTHGIEHLMGCLDATFDPRTAEQLAKKQPATRSLLWQVNNVGPYLGKLCTDTLSSTETVAVYDKLKACIRVYGSPGSKASVVQHWDNLIQREETAFLGTETHVVFANSFGEVRLSPGMKVQGIRTFSRDLIVNIRVLFNTPEVREAFFRDKHLDDKSMSWYHYDRQKMQLTVAFKHRTFVSSFQMAVLDDPQVQYLGETVGRRLQFFSQMSPEDLEGGDMLGESMGCPVANSKRSFLQRTHLMNMRGCWMADGMLTLCEDLGFENFEFFMTHHKAPVSKASEGEAAPSVTRTDVCFNSLPRGAMRSLKGLLRNGRLPREIQLTQEKGRAQYTYDFFTSDDAQRALYLLSTDPRVSEVCLTCDVPLRDGPPPQQLPEDAAELQDVFPTAYLDGLCEKIQAAFQTKVTLLYSARGRVLRLEGGKLIDAHTAVKTDVECIKFETNGDAVKEEIVRQWKNGTLSELARAKAESLVNIHFGTGEVQIYGTPSARGNIMLALAAAFERVSRVTRSYPIAPGHHLHFLSRAAEETLSSWTKGNSRVVFVTADKTVRIVGSSTDEMMLLEQKFLQYMGKLPSVPVEVAKCWCGQPSEKRFSSCGHSYCSTCLEKLVAAKQFPLRCGSPDHEPCVQGRGDSALIAVQDLQDEVAAEDFELLVRDAIAQQHDGTGGCVQFCLFRKSDNCPGIVLHGQFMACHACATPMCTRCKTTDKEHTTKTCEQFQAILARRRADEERAKHAELARKRRDLAKELEHGTLMMDIMKEIRRKMPVTTWPRVWIERKKIKDKHVHGKDEFVSIKHNEHFQPYNFTMNRCAEHPSPDECPCRIRFQAACRQIILKGGDPTEGYYAWHGTPTNEAVTAICHEGWDVSRRWGQVYGPGEYFGVTPEVSHGYACRTGKMILCFIIKTSQVKQIPGFCYVVRNPNFEQYCIPLAVVNYNRDYTMMSKMNYNSKQVPLSEPPSFHIRRPLRAPLSLPCRGFVYQGDDKRSWWPYAEYESKYLEDRYHAMKQGDTTARHVTMYICRYLDHQTAEYAIDLEQMTQINVKTKKKRLIKRVDNDFFGRSYLGTGRINDHAGTWFLLDEDSDAWHPLSSIGSEELDKLYRDYCLDRGAPIVKVCLLATQGEKTLWDVNFLEGYAKREGAKPNDKVRHFCRGVQPKKK